MEMPGRKWQGTADAYRFGMNGQEKDNEIFVGAMGAEYWEYDARTGRRWEIDPVVKEWESPYLTFSGNPILIEDTKGDDGITAGVVLMATQELAAAAAATGVGAVAVPFIEAAGAITSLIIVMSDTPISGTAIHPSGTTGRDATGVAKPNIDKRILEKFGDKSKTQVKSDIKTNADNFAGKKGAKDLVGEAKTQKAKEDKAAQRTGKKNEARQRGNSRDGNSNKDTKGSHDSGGKKPGKHDKANARRAKEQGVKGPDRTK